jgi:hypothetical protein
LISYLSYVLARSPNGKNATDTETTAPAKGDDAKNGTASGNPNPENPSPGNETAKAAGT